LQYERLEVWQRSRCLCIDVYRALSQLRDFGFKDQITRSCLSVPSNIAEGLERHTTREKARFLSIAKGSIGEFKAQTDIGIEIGYIDPELGQRWLTEAETISRMLGSFIQRLS